MARSRGKALLLAAPALPLTPVEDAKRILTQRARDAIFDGLGMTAFFEWAVKYTAENMGLDSDTARNAVLAAWNDAYDEHRETMLDA
jgi:hypothetical protein